MYLWLEVMGLVVLPHIKTKEEFNQRFELLMRRLIADKIAARLSDDKMIIGGTGHES